MESNDIVTIIENAYDCGYITEEQCNGMIYGLKDGNIDLDKIKKFIDYLNLVTV